MSDTTTWTEAQRAALAQTFPSYVTATGVPTISPSEFRVLTDRYPSCFEQYQRPAPTSAAEARYPTMFPAVKR